MNSQEIMEKAKAYREYKRMAEEAEAAADSVADEIKAAMQAAGQDKMIVGEYKLSYTDYTRKDIDKKRLQAEHKALYEAYLKETTIKRFSIA